MTGVGAVALAAAISTCGGIGITYPGLAQHYDWPCGSRLRRGTGGQMLVAYVGGILFALLTTGWLAALFAAGGSIAATYILTHLLRKWSQALAMLAYPANVLLVAYGVAHIFMR